MLKRYSFLFLLLLLLPLTAWPQKVIEGRVTDAGSGETLPSASIYIGESYRGTITNETGRYSLTIPDSLLPARVLVRYMGYETMERTIESNANRRQDFALDPSTLELGEVVVTDEDPALGIMREVIRRKQEWQARLETYTAEAYTRQVLENDTSIVSITESTSEVFWDRERGSREVLKSRRQTENIGAGQNFAGASYLPNFYGDDIEIAGFTLMGVTHPDALDYYDFKLTGYETLDNRTVYEIDVRPARRLQPLFEGTVYVLDEAYALLEVRLRPNDVVTFPPPIRTLDTRFEQQFNNYGRDFWLPVDVRLSGDLKIKMVGLEFPLMKLRQLSRLTNYTVNTELPDSLYESDRRFRTDTTATADSLLITSVEAVPLSEREQQAYATLDSTETLEKAFRPTGFLTRFMDEDGEDDDEERESRFNMHLPGELKPNLFYNRVDALHLGLKYAIAPVDNTELRAGGGYSTGSKEWSLSAGATIPLLERSGYQSELASDYYRKTDTQFDSGLYSHQLTSIPNLLGAPNYFDYYRSEGLSLRLSQFFEDPDISVEAGFTSEEHFSRPATTSYDLLGREQSYRFNPMIDDGTLYAINLTAGYNLDDDYTFGAVGTRTLQFTLEHSSPKLGSDFDFTQYLGEISWNWPTFYPRRLLPNMLDLKITAGTYSGEQLPPQQMGTVDGALGRFSPFGGFKTVRNRPLRGEHYIAAFAEHNFRSIPFEFIGLPKAAEKNWGLIAFGGAAYTRISSQTKARLLSNYADVFTTPEALQTYRSRVQTDGSYYEAGISLNGIFGIFRLDIAKQLNGDAWTIGASVARFF